MKVLWLSTWETKIRVNKLFSTRAVKVSLYCIISLRFKMGKRNSWFKLQYILINTLVYSPKKTYVPCYKLNANKGFLNILFCHFTTINIRFAVRARPFTTMRCCKGYQEALFTNLGLNSNLSGNVRNIKNSYFTRAL